MKRFFILPIILSFCCYTMAQNNKSAVTPDESCFLTKILAGNVFFIDKQIRIEDLQWNPHLKYKGVYLKHLVLGKDTDNLLSCHIVKIEPYCILDTHVHDGIIEIHEVIAGSGKFYLNSTEMDYSVGQISVIPANTPHKVIAGKDGLYLFAKFTTALQ